MTQSAPPRKAVFLCAALLAAASLNACDSQDLGKTFADIKSADVDGTGEAAPKNPRTINRKDVELVVNTARDLTTGEGGLLDKAQKSSGHDDVQIAVVDPLQLPPAAEPELQVAPNGDPVPLREKISEAPAGRPPVVVASAPVAPPAPAATGKTIQVGSFGSMASAQNAWRTLQAKYPGVEQYRPSYQSVTTAAGKSMVRLKVGPVATPAQAEKLCGQLDIRDSWCARSS